MPDTTGRDPMERLKALQEVLEPPLLLGCNVTSCMLSPWHSPLPLTSDSRKPHLPGSVGTFECPVLLSRRRSRTANVAHCSNPEAGPPRVPQDRVKMLADKLKARLQPYVDGNKADFRISAKDEAARLADHAFGAPILHVIGCVRQRCTQLVSEANCRCRVRRVSACLSFGSLVAALACASRVCVACSSGDYTLAVRR